MSSTTVFKGSFGEKPSSRVLQPPGGGSSNIFGFNDESSQPVKATEPVKANEPPKATEPLKATESQKASEPSKEFAPQSIEVGKEETETSASPATKEVAKEASTASGAAVKPQAQQPFQPAVSSRFRNSGFNPITGEPYPTAKVQPRDEDKKQTTTIVVKHPPGGASSGLW